MPKAKILVVDDEPDLELLVLQKFRKKIGANEYDFSFAKNGAEALKIVKDGSFDLILTDINMPVMDGLTLLSNIRELNRRLLRSIIVSAYGDMENIRTAMNRGAYDFITKPIDLDDLEITVDKTLKEIEYYKTLFTLSDKLVAFQQELDIATSIQTSILPKHFPAFPEHKEVDIYAKMLTAKEVGGDLYDFFPIDKNRIGIIIGDVSGKGIASALLMAVSKTLLKATAGKSIPSDSILYEVNNVLVEESPHKMFVTVFCGIYDTRNGSLEYSNGGHNLPYIIANDGSIRQLENTSGFVLGAMRDIEYFSNRVILKPGQTLFMYTDGIPEALNNDGLQYGEERLEGVLTASQNLSPKELIEKVLDCVKTFTEGTEQSDDISCVALKRN